MPTGWRIVKTRYALSAFDGEGARIHGGRWNSPGTGMVYTAHSKSLPILEVLVHVNKTGILPSYSLCAVRFGEAFVERLDRSRLPDHWRAYPAPSELRAIGDDWVQGRTSVVLEVPSAIVEGESNYLINPAHPDFSSVAVGDPEPFEFDPRLLA